MTIPLNNKHDPEHCIDLVCDHLRFDNKDASPQQQSVDELSIILEALYHDCGYHSQNKSGCKVPNIDIPEAKAAIKKLIDQEKRKLIDRLCAASETFTVPVGDSNEVNHCITYIPMSAVDEELQSLKEATK